MRHSLELSFIDSGSCNELILMKSLAGPSVHPIGFGNDGHLYVQGTEV